ncbi:GMC family oxidoreductase N-terminal domain-containing protein [Arthrobacter gandavensis]|uniref:GMC family oxidoreductase n=1 Tax=Arthrobacter gandavensis TaxID=169960 RepID=UPI00188E16B7|nr:GMC family oxidoreductase N-terminal domain-containing protein [Arthrobacter gandavensis]MBF4993258.1 GMC family oxidoreductase N-terminal domain-containing protein [Arthrobacter gandavensis]
MDADCIVVGAGGSGAPLAARLSEDPARRVLLLEAGPAYASRDQYPPELLDAGTIQAAMPGHPNNWSFPGQLTPALAYAIARGKTAGGSTAVNGGYFVRARQEDFDRWETAAGPDWSAARMGEFYARLETDRQFAHLPGHGSEGPMLIERPPQEHPITRAFREAAHTLGFPDEPDKNGSQLPGVGPLPMNVADGVRLNTALAYLEPAAGRKNLTVQGGTLVRRILFEGTRAAGVEVERSGKVSELRCPRIFLCAGAIQTAHLLLLSGIGSTEDLAAHSIAPVVHRPGVGRNFTDHPEVSVRWRPRRGVVDNALPRAMESCLNFSSGLPGSAASGDLEILPLLKPTGYLLSGSEQSMSLGIRPALRHPLRTFRALRSIPVRRLLQDWRHQDELELLVALQSETARGQLTLQSADPHEPPRLDYHYLSTAEDRARMRLAVRTAAALLATAAFRPLSRGISEPSPDILAADNLLDDWVQTRLGTALHLSGTAKMGPAEDPEAVVDPYGKVHGVQGLRVADTSVLPTVPLRGPAATAVMIGEFAAHHVRAGTRPCTN